MAEVNTGIWNALYEGGNYLLYPSEVFVQLYFRTFGKDSKRQGAFLITVPARATTANSGGTGLDRHWGGCKLEIYVQ